MAFEFDPTTLQASVKYSAEMVAWWKSLGDKASEVKGIISDTVKEWEKQGDASQFISQITYDISEKLKVINVDSATINKHLEDTVGTAKNFNVVLGELNASFNKAAASTKDWKEAWSAAEKGVRDFGGASIGVMLDLGQGIFKMGAGIAGLVAGTGGIGALVTGLVQVGQALDAMDKYWAQMNRAVYDTNAALGKMGEYSKSNVDLASDLGLKYVKNIQEVEKLIHSVATIGVSSEQLAKVTDSILDLTTRWSAMTPEKQMQLMSTYMKEFGLDGVNAHNVIKGLYLTASALKKDIKELDVMQFTEQVTRVAQDTRRMNFEFADAEKYVTVLVKQLGTAPDVLKRATEFAQGLMSYGQQSLGMQAYMMERMGVTGNVFEQLGTWTTDPELRGKAQISMFKQMIEDIGEKPIAEMGVKELAGVIKVGGFGGATPGWDEVTIAKAVKGGGAKLEELLADMEKAERKRADAQQEMPGNIAELVNATSAHTDFFKLWTETQFYRGKVTGVSYAESVAEEYYQEKGEIMTPEQLMKQIPGLKKEEAQKIYERQRKTEEYGEGEVGEAPEYVGMREDIIIARKQANLATQKSLFKKIHDIVQPIVGAGFTGPVEGTEEGRKRAGEAWAGQVTNLTSDLIDISVTIKKQEGQLSAFIGNEGTNETKMSTSRN